MKKQGFLIKKFRLSRSDKMNLAVSFKAPKPITQGFVALATIENQP